MERWRVLRNARPFLAKPNAKVVRARAQTQRKRSGPPPQYRFFVAEPTEAALEVAWLEPDVVLLDSPNSDYWQIERLALAWTSANVKRFTHYLSVSDDGLLCVSKVLFELSVRPKTRFVWSKFDCAAKRRRLERLVENSTVRFVRVGGD